MSIQNVGKGRWTLFETVSERERPIQSSPRHAEALPTNRAASQPRYRERCGGVGEHMRRKNNLALTRFGEGERERERDGERERERSRRKGRETGNLRAAIFSLFSDFLAAAAAISVQGSEEKEGARRHQHATREPSQPNKAKKGEACIEHSCGDSGQATSETCAWAGGPLLYVVVLPAARKRVQYDKTCFIIIRSRTCYDGAFVCSEPRAPERNRTERPVRGPLCLVQV